MKQRYWWMALAVPVAGWPSALSAAMVGNTTSPRDMSNFALWSIVSGFVGVWVAATINRLQWPNDVRFATFFVWSVILAGVNAYFSGDLNLHDWVRALLIVLASGVTTYNLTKGAVKSFEARTSGAPPA